jgi:hypothetical protein
VTPTNPVFDGLIANKRQSTQGIAAAGRIADNGRSARRAEQLARALGPLEEPYAIAPRARSGDVGVSLIPRPVWLW